MAQLAPRAKDCKLLIVTRSDDHAAFWIKSRIEGCGFGTVDVLDPFDAIFSRKRLKLSLSASSLATVEIADEGYYHELRADCAWLRVSHLSNLNMSHVVAEDLEYVFSEAVAIAVAMTHFASPRTVNAPAAGILLPQWWSRTQLAYCSNSAGLRSTAGVPDALPASPHSGSLSAALIIGTTVLTSHHPVPARIRSGLVRLRELLCLDVMEARFANDIEWVLEDVSASPDMRTWQDRWIEPLWKLVADRSRESDAEAPPMSAPVRGT